MGDSGDLQRIMHRQMWHTLLDIPRLYRHRHTYTRHRSLVCDDKPRDVALGGDTAPGDLGDEVYAAIHYGDRVVWRPVAGDALLRIATAAIRPRSDTIPLLCSCDAAHKTPLERLGDGHNKSDISSARPLLLELVCGQRLLNTRDRMLLRTAAAKWLFGNVAARRSIDRHIGNSDGDGHMLSGDISVGQILTQWSCPRSNAIYHSDDSALNGYADDAIIECDSTITPRHTRIVACATDVHQDETQHNTNAVASAPADGDNAHHHTDFYVVLGGKKQIFWHLAIQFHIFYISLQPVSTSYNRVWDRMDERKRACFSYKCWDILLWNPYYRLMKRCRISSGIRWQLPLW